MRITKKQAIKISIELWTWLAKTGTDNKGHWGGWDEYGLMRSDCSLCEYVATKRGGCNSCPYYLKFGMCTKDDTPYWQWNMSPTKRVRKEYARMFLEQLKQLQGGIR